MLINLNNIKLLASNQMSFEMKEVECSSSTIQTGRKGLKQTKDTKRNDPPMLYHHPVIRKVRHLDL